MNSKQMNPIEIRNAKAADKVIKNLARRNLTACYCPTAEEAVEKLLSLIPEGSSVSWGGTMSAAEIGLIKAMCEGNYKEYNRKDAKNPEEKRKMELAAYDCDYFLASANAITQDGVIVNIDGHANRVSAIAYGPRNVLMIVGMNKVVKSVDDALSRARNEAAPINAQRFDLDTPCCKTGACFDCKNPDTICCQIMITRYSKAPNRIKVILVNDDLGF